MDSEEPTTSPSSPPEPQPQSAGAPGTEGEPPRPKSRFMLAALAAIALGVIAGLLLLGILPRLKRQKKATDAAEAVKNAIPVVNVIIAERAPAVNELELPGNIEAVQTAPVSARVNGYLRRWLVDIGDHVQTGQLLAEIETPEIDQQLQQARANVAQSQAALGQAEANLLQAITNMEYTRVTFERLRYLAGQHVVPDQDRDQAWANYAAAKANVDAVRANINAAKATIAANEANVRQFLAVLEFKKIFAPFGGVITARNVEVGSLINAGGAPNISTSTGAPPTGATIPGVGAAQTNPGVPSAGGGLFQIARIDTLRIYINVPQSFTSSITSGQEAGIHVREFPQDKFVGRVARTTNAVDPASRTLLTEVRVPNPAKEGYKLLPGMYATVRVGIPLTEPSIRIPATALVIRSNGPQVVIVTPDQTAHYQNVVIGRDYGNMLDIVSGIEPGATLIVNVADDLQDGMPVRVRPSQNGPGNNEAKVTR